jgi:NAD+ synthase
VRTPFADIDYELVHRILIRFLQSEIGRTGLERGILGLSGGLDSALVAYLAVEALGVDRVTAVSMPYRSSSEESRSHARLVASATGLELLEVDISPMVDSYYKNEPDASTLRRGNKMARERMSILYDLSAEKGALVLGTSNKSELFLGYGTAFGDLASAVNPIGDLYKSEVRQLSRLLGVPTEIVDKPPSADLFAGQSDEEDLGFSYDEVDPLLRLMLDERRNTEECVEEGFDRALVERVTEMIRRSQFKRRLPVVAKISRRTVDRDFRYPRDWGTG